MKTGNLIRSARKSRNLTLQGLADELSLHGVDIDTGNLSRIETGKQSPSHDVYTAILKVFGISVDSQLAQLSKIEEPPNVTYGPDLQGAFPVISWVQAGSWSEVVDHTDITEEWLPCPGKCGKYSYVLRVSGESMFDPAGKKSFRDGDLIFVDPEKQAENGSLVVVKMVDDETATFKQLMIEENGTRYLKALNPSWPNRIMQINGDATICGVVTYKVEPM